MKSSNCIYCYFRFIEEDALPFLPECKQRTILRAHANLRARGLPSVAVDDVAVRVLLACRQYCPRDVIARIEADHAKLGLGHHGQANTG